MGRKLTPNQIIRLREKIGKTPRKNQLFERYLYNKYHNIWKKTEWMFRKYNRFLNEFRR